MAGEFINELMEPLKRSKPINRQIGKPKRGARAKPRRSSKGEEMLALQLRADGNEYVRAGFVREYRFHPVRRWRVDFAWPERILAVEIEGGSWTNGRHNRGKGFEEDCLKYNALALAGWRLLRFTPAMVKSGHALSKIQLALM